MQLNLPRNCNEAEIIREDRNNLSIAMPYKSGQRVLSPPELNFTLPTLQEIQPKHYAWESNDIQSQLPTDIVLITANDHEFISCYSYVNKVKRSFHHDVGIVYFGKFGDENVNVALVRSQMGPLPAMMVVSHATEKLNPKVVLFVGICASLNETKAKLGDVIISAKLATYASKKVTADDRPEHRGVKENVSVKMARLILSAADGWQAPLKDANGLDPKVHGQAVMLSGPELVNSDKRRLELLKYFPDAIGLEMEGEGMLEI
jgi:nucleoside phosphorylase